MIFEKVGMFKTALENPMVEGNTRVIKIPEHSPEDFDSMLYCLHKRTLDKEELDNFKDEDEKWLWLIRLWIFADYISCADVCTQVVWQLKVLFKQDEYSHLPSAEVIDYLYSNTMRGVPIRQMLVAQRIWKTQWSKEVTSAKAREQDESLEGYHPVFLSEIAGAAIRHLQSGSKANPFNSNRHGQYLDTYWVCP